MNPRTPAANTPLQPNLQTAAARAAARLKREQDERLDDELDQTFPASDPIPWHEDVRRSK